MRFFRCWPFFNLIFPKNPGKRPFDKVIIIIYNEGIRAQFDCAAKERKERFLKFTPPAQCRRRRGGISFESPCSEEQGVTADTVTVSTVDRPV